MKKVNNVTIGSDPEFFLFNKEKNEIISAEGLIGGTKDEPRLISAVGHAVQEDNIMVEFNIPPAIDAESFSRDIQFTIDYIINEIGDENITYSTKAGAEINPEYLHTEQACRFGCEPDYNAWTAEVNSPPEANATTRCSGGHIHIGYDNPDEEISVELVKAMDLFVGIPSLLMDEDTIRKTMYGKAGAFRFKNYGVEYRGISNFFIFSDELRKWVFRNTLKAVNFVNSNKTFTDEQASNIIKAIDTNDKQLATAIVKEFRLEVLHIKKQIQNV
jgi:hypothetical protein